MQEYVQEAEVLVSKLSSFCRLRDTWVRAKNQQSYFGLKKLTHLIDNSLQCRRTSRYLMFP
jgi:hypothetical protein